MYGSYHPLCARHLMLAQAYYREAARDSRAAVVPIDPPMRRTRPVRPRTPITWLVALAISLAVGATAVAALMAIDPSQVAGGRVAACRACSTREPSLASWRLQKGGGTVDLKSVLTRRRPRRSPCHLPLVEERTSILR